MRVYLGGEWIDPSRDCRRLASLIRGAGATHGLGLFESLRVHCGVPLFWRRHWDRLAAGASLLEIPLPLESESLRQAVLMHLQDSGLREARLKIMLWAGLPAVEGRYWGASTDSFLCVDVAALPQDTPLLPKSSIEVFPLSECWRYPAPMFKPIAYLPYLLARREAVRHGTDDALLIDEKNRILELSSANLIWLREGHLETTPLENGSVIPGTIRAELLECRDERFPPIVERFLRLDELDGVEGMWAANALLGVVRISRIQQVREDFPADTAYDDLFRRWYEVRVQEEPAHYDRTVD